MYSVVIISASFSLLPNTAIERTQDKSRWALQTLSNRAPMTDETMHCILHLKIWELGNKIVNVKTKEGGSVLILLQKNTTPSLARGKRCVVYRYVHITTGYNAVRVDRGS